MIEFQKLTYKNFLAVGEKPIEIDLTKAKSTLVIGKNGVGKSTFLDALSYVLFSKPHRNINKIQLVNSINLKKTLVTITFKIGPKQYKIIRGLKPNVFEIWVDGVMINQDSHSRDYQKFLETNILKLNHKSFHQVVVIGSSSFTPFMQLNAYDRRKVIEDLLDISIFSKMNQILKEQTSKDKQNLLTLQQQYNASKEKLEIQNRHIAELEKISDEKNQNTAEEIVEVERMVTELSTANEVLFDSYHTNYQAVVNEKAKEVEVYTKLRRFQTQIQTKHTTAEKHFDFFSNNTSCPTCTGEIPKNLRDDKISTAEDSIKVLGTGLNDILGRIEESKTYMDDIDARTASFSNDNYKITANNNLIKTYRERLKKLQEIVASSSDKVRLDAALLDQRVMIEAKDALDDEIHVLVDSSHYDSIIAELIKDTGVKTKIIKQYLPYMNKLISQYMNVLDFFVSFELDERFNEVIRSRHRDTFSYYSFSEGEKGRINLALLFAWRHVAKMKNSANTNLLVMDETFDASLDNDGISNLLRIMDTLDERTKVFVISHKRDMLEDKFDRTLEYTKPHNFSELNTIG